MEKFILLYGVIVGLTIVVFPALWKRMFAKWSHPAVQRRFWQRQSLLIFRLMGLALIGFCAFCAVYY